MSIKIARGKMYSLTVLHLAWAYNRLGEFKATKFKVPRSYGPRALLRVGWDVIFSRHTVPPFDRPGGQPLLSVLYGGVH